MFPGTVYLQVIEENTTNWLEDQTIPDYGLVDVKLNINKSTKADWLNLDVFTPEEVTAIMVFLDNEKPLSSVYELQLVPKISIIKLNKVLPFLTVKGGLDFYAETQSQSNLFVYSNIRSQKGVTHGSGRLRFKHRLNNNISFGLVMDQDAGEHFSWNTSKGSWLVDHIGGNILVEMTKHRFVFGNYTVAKGEGLLFGGGFSLGKGSSSVISLKKSADGILPVASVSESGYYNGLAWEFTSSGWKVSHFQSFQREDAKIRRDDLFTAPYFSSILNSGNHATTSELRDRKSLGVYETGLSVEKRWRETNISINNSAIIYSKYFRPLNRPDNILKEGGRQFHYTGISLNTQWGNVLSFGEFSIQNFSHLALIAGIIKPIDKSTDFGLLLRSYSPSYDNIRASAISENTSVSNERGLLVFASYRLPKKWELSVYSDFFSFPWLRFRVDRPSFGYESQINLNWRASHSQKGGLRFRREEKLISATLYPGQMENRILHRLSLHQSLKPNSHLEIRLRLQGSESQIGQERSYGYLFYFEPVFSWKSIVMSLRYFQFDTEGMQNIQYAYEKDMLYSFSIPPISGKGSGIYIFGKIKVKNSIYLRLKARLQAKQYQNLKEKFKFTEELTTDLKIQLQYKF